MSITEMIIVIIVAVFCLKSEDIIAIIRYIKNLKMLCNKIIMDIELYFDDASPEMLVSSNEYEINKYLEKISILGYTYEGKHSLDDIKTQYKELLKKKL